MIKKFRFLAVVHINKEGKGDIYCQAFRTWKYTPMFLLKWIAIAGIKMKGGEKCKILCQIEKGRNWDKRSTVQKKMEIAK